MLNEQVKKPEEMTHEELLSYTKELEQYKKETVYRLTDEDIAYAMHGRFGFGDSRFIPDDALELALETVEDYLEIPFVDYVESLLENRFVRPINPKVDYYNTTNDFDEIEPVYTIVEKDDSVEVYFKNLSYDEAVSKETQADVVLKDVEGTQRKSLLEKSNFLNQYGEHFEKIGEGVSHLNRVHLSEGY